MMGNNSRMVDVREDYTLMDAYERWTHIFGIQTVEDLNAAVLQGRGTELINVSEVLQEKQLSAIADEVGRRKAKLVLLAGPSSSGKTTTSKRLCIHLLVNGMHPHALSTDDYFVNRVDTPKDDNGEYDFECIGAEDTGFFQQQMSRLLAGEEVELPRYDFVKGERVFEGRKLRIGSDDVVILEGNHALNPVFSQQIPESKKYHVFVSACSAIQLDGQTAISTTDVRLLRRILRDYKYRGYSASQTIRRCPSVSAGEKKWILPYQQQADATFNSSLMFELSVMRNELTPILKQVGESDPAYSEARRLLSFLKHFRPVPNNDVPRTSLLREFLGGSSFTYD